MKNISSVITTIILGLIVGYLLTFFLFIGDWTYLFIVPSLFGIAVVLAQKGNRSIDFVKYLAVGSVLFGVCVPLVYETVWYVSQRDMGATFDMMNGILLPGFFFAAMSFIAGLLAIVVRGFWDMRK